MSSKYIVGGIILFFVGAISGTILSSPFLQKSVPKSVSTETTIDKTNPNYQAGFDS